MRSVRVLALSLFVLAACTDNGGTTGDAELVDRGSGAGDAASASDAIATDQGAGDSGGFLPDAGADAAEADAGSADATADAASGDALPPVDGAIADGGFYNCGAFSTDPGWTVQAGFRAVVIADATQGFRQPVAVAFAGGAFGNRLFVVDQGDNVLRAIQVDTGTTTELVPNASWPVAPVLLTQITWDSTSLFDGNLYVADQGADSDGDSRIYRVRPTGTATVFASAPGPAMDDLFTLVFADSSSYTPGLYVSGDTDGAGVDWARIDSGGRITAFSEVAGSEGAVFDRTGLYNHRILGARPLGGGYAGDGTITTIEGDGTAGPVLAQNLGGVHAVAISPGGAFGAFLYAASWSAGQLIRTSSTGVVEVVASGLQLTNYDGSILAFSPDGNVLYVADRLASRVVCIEPMR